MNIRDIEYFVALAEQGSFNRAAIHCNTTQPTISNSLQRMEKELGAALFKRTTRSIALTHKGLEILGYAHSILASVKIIKDIAKSVDYSSKTLNLGITTSLAYYFYDKICFSLSAITNQKIKVHEISKENLKVQLDSGVINCILLPCDTEINTYDKILIAEFPFLMGVSKDDEFAGSEIISPHELKKRNILLTQENNPYDTSLRKFLTSYELSCNQDLILNSIEIVKMAVRSKNGIGIIPKYATKDDKSIEFIPFTGENVKRKIFLVFRKNDPCIEQYKDLSAGLKSILKS
ncbi:LysR family transcriptional regulator [Pantoea ananatis]|uniref:LysR family transcriptional regulator n=1 Tax=Pantoea ananas TaxID=553 RepID=UPI001F4E250E|nr:LysR family transcriptional regulator [Pantoea ananatis]MCH9272263.1 LysR family transcriptional regulator [Pantoea ananatis]